MSPVDWLYIDAPLFPGSSVSRGSSIYQFDAWSRQFPLALTLYVLLAVAFLKGYIRLTPLRAVGDSFVS